MVRGRSRNTSWRWACAAVGILLLPVISSLHGEQAGVPQHVVDELRVLAMAFEKTWVPFGTAAAFGMRVRVDANITGIGEILGFARASEEQSASLAAELLAPLDAYSLRFAPGAALAPEDTENRMWILGEEPCHGFAVRSYLLLQLAETSASAPFVARVLHSLDRVVAAETYRQERGFCSRHPELAAQIEANNRSGHRFRTLLGSQIAWMVEQYLLWAGEHRPSYLGDKALALVAEYRQWHDGVIKSGGGTEVGLYDRYSDETMTFSRRIAEILAPAGK